MPKPPRSHVITPSRPLPPPSPPTFSPHPSRIVCFPNRPCNNITFDNVRILEGTSPDGAWPCDGVASGQFVDVTPPRDTSKKSNCNFTAAAVQNQPVGGGKKRVEVSSSAAKPDGKTYCCGVGSATACNGPDWMPISMSFSKAGASSANVSITIDGTAGTCAAETSSVSGSAVTFPNINDATDCLALLITNTGALPGDLVVTYDAGADTVGFEVDSEGVTETLQVCK